MFWLVSKFQEQISLAQSERGTATLEAGIILPVFVLLMFGMIDGSLMWLNGQMLETAAREGVIFAMGVEDLEEGTFANLTTDSAPQFNQRRIQERIYRIIDIDSRLKRMLDSNTIQVQTTYDPIGSPNSDITVTVSAQYLGLFYLFNGKVISITAKGDSIVS